MLAVQNSIMSVASLKRPRYHERLFVDEMLKATGKKINFDNSKNNNYSSRSEITAFSALPGVTFSYVYLQEKVELLSNT